MRWKWFHSLFHRLASFYLVVYERRLLMFRPLFVRRLFHKGPFLCHPYFLFLLCACVLFPVPAHAGDFWKWVQISGQIVIQGASDCSVADVVIGRADSCLLSNGYFNTSFDGSGPTETRFSIYYNFWSVLPGEVRVSIINPGIFLDVQEYPINSDPNPPGNLVFAVSREIYLPLQASNGGTISATVAVVDMNLSGQVTSTSFPVRRSFDAMDQGYPLLIQVPIGCVSGDCNGWAYLPCEMSADIVGNAGTDLFPRLTFHIVPTHAGMSRLGPLSGNRRNTSSDPTFTRWLPLSFSPTINSQVFRTTSGALPQPWGNLNCLYTINLRPETSNRDVYGGSVLYLPTTATSPYASPPGTFIPANAITDANGDRLLFDNNRMAYTDVHSTLVHFGSGYQLINAGSPGAMKAKGRYTYTFNSDGSLASIADDVGNQQIFNWSGTDR
jgi:hypothetical protein